jgi:outer membrane protein OmpA-like peptidoglycan-associated protein
LYSWLENDKPTTALSSPTTIEQPENKVPSTILEDNQVLEQSTIDTTSTAPESPELTLENTEDDIEPVKQDMRALDQYGETLFIFNEGIAITKNSSEISVPEGAIDFKYKIQTYLTEHPDSEVHIHSFYSATEEFESPNFGTQRGKEVQKILINAGVSAEKVVIKPVIKEIDFSTSGTFQNGFSFAFKPLDPERVANITAEIPDSKTFYPLFSGTDIQVNQKLKDVAAEVKEIMENNPDVKVVIVGHTDSQGNAVDNYRKALNYARQVKWYMVAKGNLDRRRVVAKSEVETKYLASNKTQRGRIANKRIELIYLQ